MQQPTSPTDHVRTGPLAWLGRLVAHHPKTWLLGWVVVTVACFVVAVGGVTGQSLFNRLHTGDPTVGGEAQQARTLIERVEPSLDNLTLQVRGADLTDATAVKEAATRTLAIRDIPGVHEVRSPLLSPKGLDDPAAAPLLAGGTPGSGGFVTVVDFDADLTKAQQDAAAQQVTTALQQIPEAWPDATGSVGGVGPVVDAITSTIERDLLRGEGIALPLTFVVMFFVFGGFIAAGMPVVGAIAAIGGALLSLFVFSHTIELDATVVNIVTLLGFGLSIDYGLLTVSRFREELALARGERRGLTQEQIVAATERTVATAGRTVLFSGLTVAIALSGLLVFEAEIMKAIGLAGVSVVLVALIVAITLVPALAVLGARQLARRARVVTVDEGAFSTLARAVQRRPVLVIVGVTAVLVFLALPIFSVRLTSSGTELLPKSAPQRVFFEELARDYPALSSPEVTVVAASSDPAAVTAWAQQLESEPGVTSVSVRPLGTDHQLVSVRVTGPPTSDDAQALVEHVRETPAPFQTLTTGQAATQMDFLASMARGAPYAVLLVVVGTFILLFLMTGSVVIPIKALVLNVLSLGAALGVVVWIFEDGHLQGLLSFSSVGAVESMVPFLVLAFGFGLSMDYEVFLLSRITEFHNHGHDNDRSVSLGLQRTGRIITSAALLIVIVFAGFIAGDILIIKEVGVALVAAVLIDATLVRLLLVPATMTVLGRWNWWAPRGLRRLHERFGITD
ncbi:MAG: MMPL family transporter [Intrasporangium sp.]|uniref:MMPL family transporter n=1 Tax=Intrasporangium sp. TaxID=1925024 RepID=UPI0026493325|nr:MMPL family transporter [Intrasporangium sp.]MDN5794177.1 MMPL family transporter [Intrasporangium sp.]